MKLNLLFCWSMACLCSSLYEIVCIPRNVCAVNKSLSSHVRVLLASWDSSANHVCSISGCMQATVSDLQDTQAQYQPNTDSISLMVKNERLYLNGKRVKSLSLRIQSPSDLMWENRRYGGDIYITYDPGSKKMLLINRVPLESYVACVVACESFSVWPVESHKVSAIVSRTFAAHKCMKHTKKLYDVKATNSDQSYRGITDHAMILEGVQATKDVILMWNGNPIIAMYDICCGGVIPKHCAGIDFKQHPYLARPYACDFCSNYRAYRWNLQYTHTQACERLSKFLGKKVIGIVSIQTNKRGNSGAVKSVTGTLTIQTKKGKKNETVTFNNQQLRKIFDVSMQGHSAWFTIAFDKKNGVQFRGKGHGHHLGLCQRGAKNLIDQGKTYVQILMFYFPECTLARCIGP